VLASRLHQLPLEDPHRVVLAKVVGGLSPFAAAFVQSNIEPVTGQSAHDLGYINRLALKLFSACVLRLCY
jgi:hypothetical protein